MTEEKSNKELVESLLSDMGALTARLMGETTPTPRHHCDVEELRCFSTEDGYSEVDRRPGEDGPYQEMEIYTQHTVSHHQGEENQTYPRGTLKVTTRWLIFVPENVAVAPVCQDFIGTLPDDHHVTHIHF